MISNDYSVITTKDKKDWKCIESIYLRHLMINTIVNSNKLTDRDRQ